MLCCIYICFDVNLPLYLYWSIQNHLKMTLPVPQNIIVNNEPTSHKFALLEKTLSQRTNSRDLFRDAVNVIVQKVALQYKVCTVSLGDVSRIFSRTHRPANGDRLQQNDRHIIGNLVNEVSQYLGVSTRPFWIMTDTQRCVSNHYCWEKLTTICLTS